MRPLRLWLLGSLDGMLFGPFWALVIVPLAVEAHSGLPRQFVTPALLGGGAVGAGLLLTRLGRWRRRVAVASAALVALAAMALRVAAPAPAAVAATALAACTLLADGCLGSAVNASLPPTRRARGLMPYWAGKGCVWVAMGLSYESLLRRLGFAGLMQTLAMAMVLAAVLIALVAPDPDEATRATPEAAVPMRWIAAAALLNSGQNATYGFVVPLALAERQVGWVGLIKLAGLAGVAAMWWAPRLSVPVVASAAPLVAMAGSALALAGYALGLPILPVTVTAGACVTAGVVLHACSQLSICGATSRGMGIFVAAQEGGGFAFGIAAAGAWSQVAPDLRYLAVVATGACLSALTFLATRVAIPGCRGAPA